MLRTAVRPSVPGVMSDLPPKLRVRNLNFFYGAYHALREITLDIPEKKVTAFIGPSGCGKSTLLRTLNRMYSLYPGQRAEGRITLNRANILARSVFKQASVR